MTKQQRVAELRAMAADYRAIARKSNDGEKAAGTFELAAKLEQQARDIEQGK
jgi:hypothetical protein